MFALAEKKWTFKRKFHNPLLTFQRNQALTLSPPVTKVIVCWSPLRAALIKNNYMKTQRQKLGTTYIFADVTIFNLP